VKNNKKYLMTILLLFTLSLIGITVIRPVQGNPGPDLVNRGTTWDGFYPNKAVPWGTNISLFCDVLNQGDAASGAFSVSFYASLDTTITGGDYEIVKVPVSSIAAGVWANVYWFGPFPVSIPNDTYYVGWIIDVDFEVAEDNEGNNIAYETVSQLSIVIEAELYNRGGPNGGFQYSGYTPTEVMPSVTLFSIWCDIINVGLKPSGPFNVSFVASYNPTISGADYEFARVTVPSINNGSYADVSWTGIFPFIPFSSFFVGWVIDVNDDVPEGSEYDDSGRAEYAPLVVSNKSDLVDRGSSYSGMSSPNVYPLTAFTVWADIENIGLKSSESCNISFYASTDTNITTLDTYLGSDTLSVLTNGSFGYVEWSGTFPNITLGTYYIGWLIDVKDDVDEGNENNNKAYISSILTVGPASKSGIPGYDPLVIIGVISIASVIYILNKRKKK